MNFQITELDIKSVVNCVPEAIERILKVIQIKLENYLGGHNVQVKKGGKKKKKAKGFKKTSGPGKKQKSAVYLSQTPNL